MGHPVVHFQIGVKDDSAAVKFYSELFGWTLAPVPGMPYHTAQTGSPLGIQGGIAKVEQDADAVVTFYVEVPDVASSLSHAESLGAKIVMPATPVMPTLTLGMFVDPQGRAIGLSHDTTPSPVSAAPRKSASAGTGSKKAKKGKKNGKGKKSKSGKKGRSRPQEPENFDDQQRPI